MIISPARGYIFVHIPKTGGTSMARALETMAHPDDIHVGDTPLARARRDRLAGLAPRGRLWKHSTLADIDGIVSPEALSRMFVFALVRNPWDRMVSYYHWLRAQTFDHPAVGRAKSRTFAAFLADPATGDSLRRQDYAHYLRDVTGTERATCWIRLEHLSEDIAPLAAHLGEAPEVGHANRSDRAADWRGYYDATSAARVAEICATDIARFGYRFDP